MDKWTAYYCNDPNNDFNLYVEIYFKDREIGFIRPGESGLELGFFDIDNLKIPLDWLLELMNDAKKRLNDKKQKMSD